ncbi:MAG: phosphatase PAP2 family protein [Candidatus Symbiothrix sp.]|jgi:undecaprenyl-diphosphatase|nr:phosphatase PAP2 family protein [Candidatus Symbiothrix sp.]
MLEQELVVERGLFFFLNGHHTAFWDDFFWLVSDKWAWVPFYACFLFVFAYKKHWKELVPVLLALALVIVLCDQIASGWVKPFVHRFRPTHHPDFQNLVQTVRDYRGGTYGFFSSHAANAFGLAVFTSLLFKNRKFTCTMLLFAGLTGYSRLYLGVHFVSDVVVGALVGSGVAWLIYTVYVVCCQGLGNREGLGNHQGLGNRKGCPYNMYSNEEILGLCIVFFIFIAIFLLMSFFCLNLAA